MASPNPPQPARLLVGVLLVPLIVIAALSAFAWPAARLEPRHLPLGVAGSEQTVTALTARLEHQANAIDVHMYKNETEATQAIKDRDVYGAIVTTPEGVTVLTASAASPIVAQELTSVAAQATGDNAGAAKQPPHIVDVVPASPKDPRGVALSSSVLPLVLAGVLTGLIVTGVSRPGAARLGALITAAAMAGLAGAAITQSWLGVIGGNWVANAAVLGLTVLAIASLVAGLDAVWGRIGQVVAAMLMVFIGNPFSGVSSAPELLPQPVGRLGQLLPPGAGGNLLRSTAFFDGNGAAVHLTVLLVWVGLGLTPLIWAGLRSRQESRPTKPETAMSPNSANA